MSSKASKAVGAHPKAAPRKTGTPKAIQARKSSPAAAKPMAPETESALSTSAPQAAKPLPLRRKELIENVQARVHIKNQDVRPVLDAVLQEMGAALAEGREMVLPPFGKIRINRVKTLPNGRVSVIKVRQTTPKLAATEEDAADTDAETN